MEISYFNCIRFYKKFRAVLFKIVRNKANVYQLMTEKENVLYPYSTIIIQP